MADALYNVVIRLTQETGASGPFSSETLSKAAMLDNHVSKIGQSFDSFGKSVSDVFTGVLDKVADVGVGIAKWGAVGAMGAVTYGVAGLNAEFEKTQISLAAIFNANGVSSNMTEGLRAASTIMSKIQTDAAALPGEASDLVGIFRAVSIPGLRAGQDVNSLEKFSANVMAAGASSGLDMATVAREAGALLSGRAGSHNILGSTLFGLQGADAQSFNSKSASERFEYLAEAMKKYGGAIETYGHSFEGLKTSLHDGATRFLRLATEPVFHRVEGVMERMNKWSDDNHVVASLERNIGGALVRAFDVGERMVLKWEPIVVKFAMTAETRLVGAFSKMEPMVDRIGKILERALSDPDGTIDKLTTMFELGAAMKFAGPLASMGSAGLGAVGVAGAGVGSAVLLAGAADAFALEEALKKSNDATTQWQATLEHTSGALGHLANIGEEIGPGLNRFVVAQGEIMMKTLAVISSAADTTFGALDKIVKHISDDPIIRSLFATPDGHSKNITKGFDHLEDGILRHVANATMKTDGKNPKDKPITGGGGTTINARVEMVVNQNGDANRVARAVIDVLADRRRYPGASPHTPNYSR